MVSIGVLLVLTVAAGAEAIKPEYCCQAGADAAAANLRALQSAYHQVEVVVEAYPTYGRGGPSARKPRAVKALESIEGEATDVFLQKTNMYKYV